MRWASIGGPLTWASAQKPPFGRDHQVFWIGVERFCNQQFAYIWSVGVGGIDQVDPQFEGATQDGDGSLLVRWRPPNAWPSDPHCAKAEAVYRQILTDGKRPAGCGRLLVYMLHN